MPLFFPPDVYERHRVVAAFIHPEDTVLDVGGELGQLKKFARARKIRIADINRGDIRFDGKTLPVFNRSFTTVTAIDVLEHIPPAARPAFVKELWRVAAKQLIVATPYGSPAHEKAEREEMEHEQEKGRGVRYLEEHVRYGLPRVSDLHAWSPTRNSHFFFAGDFRWSRFLFRLHQWTVGIGIADRLLFLKKMFFYAIVNVFLFPILVRLPRHAHTNRMYVIWERR